MSKLKDTGREIIDFDPIQSQLQSIELGFTEPGIVALLPDPVPWPSGLAPTPVSLMPEPLETDDLSRFKGYDAVVVTWTVGEATAMASLFTPGHPLAIWYEYRHNVNNYIPLVTEKTAPFYDDPSNVPRYVHSMGLYFPCEIGTAKVLLFKSGLHFCYDGPAFPVKKLMAEIYDAVKPKVFITTGTGGGIGADVLLGDVIIAPQVKFDCFQQYINEPFHNQVFSTSPLPAGVLAAITPGLTQGNGSRVTGGNAVPKMWTDNNSIIVTTDTFAYDDVQNTDHLQGLGRVCDMGDAMVAFALKDIPDLQFFAIRNASDPQMPVPDAQQPDKTKKSSGIYKRFGTLTSAASLVATWAVLKEVLGL